MKTSEPHPLVQLAAVLLSPTGTALASWLQTLAVVVGLYVAVGQLQEMAAQTQSPRNVRYDELLQKHELEVGEAVSQVRSVGAWARQGNWSDQQLVNSIAELEAKYGHKTKAIVELQVKHLEALLRCAARELCPADKVHPYVCRDAGRT